MLIDLLDKLVDRVIQLATIQEQKRAKLLAEYLEPIFARFDQLNSEYLTAFERYRAMIANSADPDWLASLQATLEKDNLFTTHTRTQLQRLAEAKKSPDVEEFIDGICEYLLGARLLEPVGKQVHPHAIQRWRQSLNKTLDRIAEEAWQLVLDPDGAAPPLSATHIEADLQQHRHKYRSYLKNITEPDLAQRAAAMAALDGVVTDMQWQYGQVFESYATLREKCLE
jgi:hypothetical protein